MGWVGVLAQCALDFLVDERCHACGGAFAAGTPAGPAPALAAPVEVVALARFRLTSRVLCPSCALRVRRWPHRILLAPPAGGPATSSLSLHAAFVTDERLLIIIHLLKFGRRERIAAWLARAMLAGLPPLASAPLHAPRIVAPVPMDRHARVRRGFNQAESVARVLAAGWGLALSPHALVKVRRTHPQSALGRQERLVNLDGAFRADASRVRGRSVVVVDDLVTTGATAHACAEALRSAGACEVHVVCAGYRDETRASTGAFLQS